jgi:hypothetical protein
MTAQRIERRQMLFQCGRGLQHGFSKSASAPIDRLQLPPSSRRPRLDRSVIISCSSLLLSHSSTGAAGRQIVHALLEPDESHCRIGAFGQFAITIAAVSARMSSTTSPTSRHP